MSGSHLKNQEKSHLFKKKYFFMNLHLKYWLLNQLKINQKKFYIIENIFKNAVSIYGYNMLFKNLLLKTFDS